MVCSDSIVFSPDRWPLALIHMRPGSSRGRVQGRRIGHLSASPRAAGEPPGPAGRPLLVGLGAPGRWPWQPGSSGFTMAVMGGDRADADLAVALLGPIEIGSAGGVMTPVAQPRLRVLLGRVCQVNGVTSFSVVTCVPR